MIECRFQCGSPAQRDGMCRRCRLHHGLCRRKYFWTEEQIAKLRWAYEAKGVKELKQRIDRVVAITGFPRTIVCREAQRQGLASVHRPWTEIEKQYVRDHVGEMTACQIARVLHRGVGVTYNLIHKLGFSARVREGYTLKDLCQAFGVSEKTVNYWLNRGWMRLNPNDRVSEPAVLAFIRKHPDEYSLRRVDEYWFKSLVFPHFGIEARDKVQREVA